MKKQKFYMNPSTGSVDTMENWKYDQNFLGFPKSDLKKLIEVRQDENGKWVEAE